MEKQYFKCLGCEQVVQGWEASNWVTCCEVQNYVEVPGPEEDKKAKKKREKAFFTPPRRLQR